ncbi:predicted protein [Histoplasma capsulatum G186AR]|uniref:Uncharacterized protein n=2 Tax=Ajellomyces capsulatus TaxID=5037 RepID=C0NF77_AJECG|nr:uncharacterized protein HCBG_01543 [Histoplasma capsulatum G186AR]EEH09898.1 predicted protein [Histoplasma capsulatum G186AR]
MQESSAAQKKGNGQGNYKLIDARGPSLDSMILNSTQSLKKRESSTSENNLDIMDQHSKLADNNGMNNQYRDLTKATTPHRAEKEADKNKVLLDKDAKSPFSENISKGSKKQETGKGNLLASAPAKRPEPVLHLRGGGCVASSVVNRMAPNRHPDDNERPTKLLWYMIGGVGPPPTFGEIRRSRKSDKEDKKAPGQGGNAGSSSTE